MKGKYIIACFMFLFLLGSGHIAQGQIQFGIKAGLNTVDIDKETLTLRGSNGIDSLALGIKDAQYGINVGIFLMIKTKNFYVMPELIYNSNAVDYTLKELGDGRIKEVFQEKYQNLDIPITMGLRLNWLRLGAGPVAHVHLKSTNGLLDFKGYKQDFAQATLGWQAGLGIDFWSINIDLRYEGNFTNFGDHFNFFGDQYEFSNSPTRLIGTIGISF